MNVDLSKRRLLKQHSLLIVSRLTTNYKGISNRNCAESCADLLKCMTVQDFTAGAPQEGHNSTADLFTFI